MATQKSSGGVLGWLIFAALVVGLIVWNPVGRRKHGPPPPPAPSDAAVTISTDVGVAEPATPGDASIDAVSAADVAIDAAPPADPLYTITEALDDIAASPLEYIGTGAWFGNFSIKACAYRNAHVLVVWDYCTFKEQPALGLHVISPTRGSVHVYVEADKAISTLVRSNYMTFRIEGFPQTDPPPELDFTYDEVNAWHERRYNAHAGACWVTVGDTACAPEVIDRLDAWSPSAEAFLADPGARWYALAKTLHSRTVRDLRSKK